MAKLRKSITKSKKKSPSISVKKLMDLGAPTGYRYVPSNEISGFFHLVPKNPKDVLSFSSKMVVPKEIDGFEVTQENLYDVMFITQKPIKFKSDEVRVGDKTGHVNGLLYKTPYVKAPEGKMLISPPETIKMSEPIVMAVGGEKIEFLIERIPYPSLEIQKFRSFSPEYIKFDLLVDTKENKMTFNYKLEYSKLKYIDDFLDKKNIIRALNLGDVKIEGLDSYNTKRGESTLEAIDYQINFLEKMAELQKILGVRFENVDVTGEEMVFAKKLYCSLVKNSFYSFGKPLRKSYKLQYKELNPEIIELLESRNPKLYMWREMTTKVLMGCEITVVEVKYSTKIVFDNLNEAERTLEYRFLDDGREMYKMYIPDEERSDELKIDRELENPNIIEIKNFDWDSKL
ncbi:abortive infection system toxin AbiGii family protein [Lactococcus lactis]|uniref:abortive infection system toxin AbiGii family protein n=1 Tax=Lactococcus lactis TaxID=1358 RepID=UPI003981DB2B